MLHGRLQNIHYAFIIIIIIIIIGVLKCLVIVLWNM